MEFLIRNTSGSKQVKDIHRGGKFCPQPKGNGKITYMVNVVLTLSEPQELHSNDVLFASKSTDEYIMKKVSRERKLVKIQLMIFTHVCSQKQMWLADRLTCKGIHRDYYLRIFTFCAWSNIFK